MLSERIDDEKRKISVINLNELSAAFYASSRMRSAAPPLESAGGNGPQQRRYSQEERLPTTHFMSSYVEPKLSSDKDVGSAIDKDAGRRKRQGVEKYVSDSSQLNLQFERRRLSQQRPPSSSDLATASVIRQRSSLGFDASSHTTHPAASYSTDQGRSRVQLFDNSFPLFNTFIFILSIYSVQSIPQRAVNLLFVILIHSALKHEF